MTGSAEYAVNVSSLKSDYMLQRHSRTDKKQCAGARDIYLRRKRVIFFPASSILFFFPSFLFADLFTAIRSRVRFQSWEFIFSPIGAAARVHSANLPGEGGRYAVPAEPGRERDPSLFPSLPVPLSCLPICPRWIDVGIRILLRTGVREALNRIRVIEGAIRAERSESRDRKQMRGRGSDEVERVLGGSKRGFKKIRITPSPSPSLLCNEETRNRFPSAKARLPAASRRRNANGKTTKLESRRESREDRRRFSYCSAHLASSNVYIFLRYLCISVTRTATRLMAAVTKFT